MRAHLTAGVRKERSMLFMRGMPVIGFKAERLQTIPRAIAGFGTLLVSLTAAGVLVTQFAGV